MLGVLLTGCDTQICLCGACVYLFFHSCSKETVLPMQWTGASRAVVEETKYYQLPQHKVQRLIGVPRMKDTTPTAPTRNAAACALKSKGIAPTCELPSGNRMLFKRACALLRYLSLALSRSAAFAPLRVPGMIAFSLIHVGLHAIASSGEGASPTTHLLATTYLPIHWHAHILTK